VGGGGFARAFAAVSAGYRPNTVLTMEQASWTFRASNADRSFHNSGWLNGGSRAISIRRGRGMRSAHSSN